MKYLLQLSDDCEWTDEEIKELRFDLIEDCYGERVVIYKPLNNKTINVSDIPFWENVECIEAFDESEQIKGQLEFWRDFI